MTELEHGEIIDDKAIEGGVVEQETVTAPAKVMRIGSMIKQLLDEVRSMTTALSPDLQQELRTLALPFKDGEIPSDAELRIAKAQLVGWLEGLFHGIQATMFAQQLSMRQQSEQRQIQSGVSPTAQPGDRPGTYL